MKAQKLYDFADPHIHSMFIHDIRGVILENDLKFRKLYAKPDELVLKQKLTPAMLWGLVNECVNRVLQAQYYLDHKYELFCYDEIRVQKAYEDVMDYILSLKEMRKD